MKDIKTKLEGESYIVAARDEDGEVRLIMGGELFMLAQINGFVSANICSELAVCKVDKRTREVHNKIKDSLSGEDLEDFEEMRKLIG